MVKFLSLYVFGCLLSDTVLYCTACIVIVYRTRNWSEQHEERLLHHTLCYFCLNFKISKWLNTCFLNAKSVNGWNYFWWLNCIETTFESICGLYKCIKWLSMYWNDMWKHTWFIQMHKNGWVCIETTCESIRGLYKCIKWLSMRPNHYFMHCKGVFSFSHWFDVLCVTLNVNCIELPSSCTYVSAWHSWCLLLLGPPIGGLVTRCTTSKPYSSLTQTQSCVKVKTGINIPYHICVTRDAVLKWEAQRWWGVVHTKLMVHST